MYAAATLALGHAALRGGFLVSTFSDQYIGGFPVREFAAQSLKAGHGIPLWNPYIFGGLPYVAAMHGDIFYPTFLLRALFPTDIAMTWSFVLHVFLAGLFTYVFLRAVGLSFFGALIGGLSYLMGGNIAGLVSPGHDGKLYVAALLPLVLLFLYRGIRQGRQWAWGALAIAVMLAVLSPHPQLLQYLLLTAGAWSLYLAFTADDAGEMLPRRVAIQRLALATVAVALGFLGGAIQYAPVLEYVPWSPRAGGRGWEHAVSYSMPPEELLSTYLPQFSGILERYWGRNGLHFHSEYLGASVLVIFGLALGSSGTRRRFVWFWTGTLIIATLWALGGYTPFYHLVYALVPGTKFFRAPSTMLLVVAFCVAVLAAAGVDRLLTAPPRLRYAVAWTVAALVVAVLATLGALTNFGLVFVYPQWTDRLYENAPALTLGAWRSFVVVALTAGVIAAFARGRLSPRVAALLLAGIVGLDLWSVVRLYWRFSPRAAELYASDAAIDYLRAIPQPGRVVPLALDPLVGGIRDPYLGSQGDGRVDGLMVHGVRSVVGNHGNELGRYDVLTGWDADWPRQLGNPNLRRLTNTRYLYTTAAKAPLEGMRLVAGPTRNVAGNTVYLYEFGEDNPLAWVVPLAVKAPDDNVLATVLDSRFDVRRVALFDTGATVPVRSVPSSLPDPIDVAVHVTRWEPARIALALDRPSPAGAALLVSENYYPGWSALADGKPAPIGRADYSLIGVALPGGTREVVLTYTSARYDLGKTITLVVLPLALLWLAMGFVTDRRRKRSHA